LITRTRLIGDRERGLAMADEAEALAATLGMTYLSRFDRRV
jgi:hypothetical protein